MSWLFSQALVEDYWPATCSESEPSAQLNLVDTQHKFSHNGKTMDALTHFRYGLTCELLTPENGEALLTSCLEAFRARTLARQEGAQELGESARGFGPIWQESLTSQEQLSLLSKTAHSSGQEGLTSSCKILPTWGSMQNGELSQLPISERLTPEKECGYSLPTPSGVRSGKNHVAGRLDEWGGSSNPFRGTEYGKIKSPAFEEWMMGWPVQWTELTQSATARFQSWRLEHSVTL